MVAVGWGWVGEAMSLYSKLGDEEKDFLGGSCSTRSFKIRTSGEFSFSFLSFKSKRGSLASTFGPRGEAVDTDPWTPWEMESTKSVSPLFSFQRKPPC